MILSGLQHYQMKVALVRKKKPSMKFNRNFFNICLNLTKDVTWKSVVMFVYVITNYENYEQVVTDPPSVLLAEQLSLIADYSCGEGYARQVWQRR
jgi:hypothetical protein